MLKRFLSYYKPHKKTLTLDLLASFFMSIIGIVYPIITRIMLNDLIPKKQYAMIVAAGGGLLLLYFVKMLLNYYIQYVGHIMGVKMQAQMRREMFCHLQTLPYSFFDNHETGKIMSRMTNDLMDISELAHHGPENLIISTISIVASFIYLTTIDVWLTLIIFICVPLLIGVSILLRGRMRNAFMRSRRSIAVINAALENSISGIRVTKAFANSGIEQDKFEVGNSEFVSARSDAYEAMGRFHAATTFITEVFNVIVLIAGGLFMYSGRINFADYSAFIVSVNIFLSPVRTLIGFVEQFQDGATGFERFCEIMDTESERDKSSAVPLVNIKGHIQFCSVSYSYKEGEEVLHSVNLDIKPGETFALVGPSGGGKTTICHLIPRFYRFSAGSIKVDGTDIRECTMDSLRSNIGIVQQDVYLFNSTIGDNILYGRPDATRDEVIKAAKRANVHEYIMSLPQGYDTEIGERGVRLSGGQKQRISIARVFLKDPPILILDEATSALDNATEIIIQSALDELCKGRTTLVVAHRLSTIKNADRIAVISNGEVAEQGTHDELMSLGGTYSRLYSLQFR